MKKFVVLVALLLTAACTSPEVRRTKEVASQPLALDFAQTAEKTYELPKEVHFKNLKQLTTTGTNAEAYWSFDGEWLSFQHRGPESNPHPDCDQIYSIRKDGKDLTQISTGLGRTTCSYALPNDKEILFASTHWDSPSCPTKVDHSKGYVWPIYNTFQIFVAPADTGLSAKDRAQRARAIEPGAPIAYNAEATVCKDGKVVFTSDRDGDLDLYTGQLAPGGVLTNVKRVTRGLGYDGGAFFSQDCSKLVWRASRPRPGKEADEYRELLKQHLVKPSEMEIWVGNADGSDARQVTKFGSNTASFAPFYTPKGDQIIFASNLRKPGGRNFDLYLINTNGSGLERVTYSDTFESFPMFSPDGKLIAFSSNRNNREARDTNLFVGEWNPSAKGELIPRAEDRFLETVTTLASAEMRGRAPGDQGLTKAEGYVEARFKRAKLRPFFGDTFRQEVEFESNKSANVVAMTGAGCGKSPAVVLGAHLDHLGVRSDGATFGGADDNASGVAGLLEVAESLRPKVPCLVVAAFTAEEKGVVGSARFIKEVQKRKFPIKAMINFDMIGRVHDNKVLVLGADTAEEWKAVLGPLCAEARLDCVMGGDGYGPSDQMPFFQSGIPVLHFFSGAHVDHHAVSDTADKINATGGVQIAQLAAGVIGALRNKALHFKPAAPSSVPLATGDGSKHGGGGGYLGTIPDYVQLAEGTEATKVPGLRLSGARPGSPADQAGVRAGDFLTAIQREGAPAPRSVANLKDFAEILKGLSPGDKVTLQIRREDTSLALPAVVGTKN